MRDEHSNRRETIQAKTFYPTQLVIHDSSLLAPRCLDPNGDSRFGKQTCIAKEIGPVWNSAEAVLAIARTLYRAIRCGGGSRSGFRSRA